jgi:hypothetical protein
VDELTEELKLEMDELLMQAEKLQAALGITSTLLITP